MTSTKSKAPRYLKKWLKVSEVKIGDTVVRMYGTVKVTGIESIGKFTLFTIEAYPGYPNGSFKQNNECEIEILIDNPKWKGGAK